MKQIGTSPNRLRASLKAAVEKVSATKTADFFNTRRNEAEIDVALRILHREGDRPPVADDVMS